MTVQVEPGNRPPEAVDDFAFTTGGGTINVFVLDNDFDPDPGDVPFISGFAQTTAFGGTVSQSGDTLVYQPQFDFTGTDSFSYTISDGELTDTATVTVTVDLPPGPIAFDDFATTTENIAASIPVLQNDFDPDGFLLEITSFSEASVEGGTVSLDDNDTPFDTNDDLLVYEPDEGFTGTDSFSYTIADSDGLTASATVTVTVEEPDNRPPEAVDDEAETQVDIEVNIPILDNDFDLDGDDVELFDAPSTSEEGGDIDLDTNGTIRDLTDDSLIYTPPAGFTGTDEFTYTITDGEFTDTATVTVTVNPEPDPPPMAVDDSAETTEQMPVEIDVLANDSDEEGIFELSDFEESTQAGGTVVRIDNNGTIFDLSDDVLEYTPAEGFTGTDSFIYTITDSAGQTDTATVTVRVLERPNTAPEAFDDFASTSENIPVTIDVLDNDTDPEEDTLLLGRFQATTSNGGTVTRDNNGTPRELSDDRLVYTPAPGFVGVDTFIYTVSDGELTDPATVTVNVDIINQLPIAVDDFASTTANNPVNVFVLDNDTDPDIVTGDLIAISNFPTSTAFGGIVSLNGNALEYTPQSGFAGTDSFNYTIADSFGATASATVTVQVIGNQPPIAGDDFASTTENVPVSVFVLDNDFDPDFDVVSVVGFAQTTANGGSVSQSGNTLLYNPGFGFTGADSFNYTISDGELTSSATVSVTVNPPINQPPIAVDDLAFTTQDISTSIFVLDNDFDPEGDVLSIVGDGFTTANGGSVSISGNALLYNPGFGFTGADSFNYTISDGELTSSATVTVTVNPPINQPPIAGDDFAFTTQDISTNIFVLDNDSDPEGDVLSIVGDGFTTANGGSVSISGNALVYNPGFGFTGADSFSYTISDGELTSSATVSVTVDPPPTDAPVANEDNVIVSEGESASIPVLLNDTPRGGLQITATSDASNGTTSISGNRVLYTPEEGFTDTDSFSYTISDSFGRTSTADVNLDIQPSSDSLTGGSGPELLIGIDRVLASREVLDGGAGNDTLLGNRGADILIGGDGADVFAYFNLADSGADPEDTTELGDTIRDFDPTVDRILLDFEVAPGNRVSQGDVEINLIGITSGVAAIGLATANTPPEFLPEQFVIVLRNLPPTTTAEEIRSGLIFSE